jgi:hypothetical protein
MMLIQEKHGKALSGHVFWEYSIGSIIAAVYNGKGMLS